MSAEGDQKTHFGFETVSEEEKVQRVHGVFTSVAAKYDLMNDAMTMGVHRLWKDAFLDWMAPRRGVRVLDVAGGTGDIAFRYLDRIKGEGHVTVLDLTERMLIEGRRRGEAEGREDCLDWVVGDAMSLPFEASSFDNYTISFGIRNVSRIETALSEAFRVLRPGGRLMILEFSRVPNAALRKIYDFYSFNVLPNMGQVIAGDRDSYQYLVESIRRFPDQETLKEMIQTSGFEQVAFRNLSMGVVAMHSGWKI